ncbi:E3 ubiquitin-protein ligase [Perilla frutescens var. hirtella]|uniref:E3 ubiquitin-protein ligase n=1 Tax=Perilla frutescens var. hirtella TaxID=608512 RepID=A0AAD4JNP5_PERFH|nr:E3 ubiquitin-protein ligase [Perilla frutescens var. hirtella]
MNYNGESPRLELKLNLSPPREHRQVSTKGAISSREISPRSSCVSRETSPDGTLPSPSPEGISMMLVGCPRCLMYVMLFEEDPKCPKCKSTVLLDFLHHK